jgi:hypothetical protein
LYNKRSTEDRFSNHRYGPDAVGPRAVHRTIAPHRPRSRNGRSEPPPTFARLIVPFVFLVLSVSAYIYVVLRVVMGYDLPAIYSIGMTNDGMFIGLVLVIVLTLITNLAWRTYLRRRMDKGHGGRIGDSR